MTAASIISVVLATRDRQGYALDCLRSIMAQSYFAYEVLVIDQSDQLSLQDAIRGAFPEDGRIRYFHLDEGGLSEARNLGVQHAAGQIIAFIDDDAIAAPGWLQGIAEAFEHAASPALIAGRIDPIWSAPRPRWFPREREFLLSLYHISETMCRMPDHDLPIGANMAGLRRVILEAGGFDSRFGPVYARGRNRLITGDDTLLGERIKSLGYSLYYQPKATVRHRIPPHRLTRRYYLRRHFWEGVTTIKRMSLLGQVSPPWRKHRIHHVMETGMALARFLLPRFENRYPQYTSSEIRMLALSRVAFSAGVLYGMGDTQPESVERS